MSLDRFLPKNIFIFSAEGAVRIGSFESLPNVPKRLRYQWLRSFADKLARRAEKITAGGQAICIPERAYAGVDWLVTKATVLNLLRTAKRPVVVQQVGKTNHYTVDFTATRRLGNRRSREEGVAFDKPLRRAA